MADNGCHELARVATRIVTAEPGIDPRDFLRALGQVVAGISPGVEGIFDLARGGSNEVAGRGFRPEFDDESRGQARHFAGTAASAAIFGPRVTEIVAHRLVDPPDTADGRLSAAAVEFARLLIGEELLVSDASQWILDEICAPEDEAAMRINPAPRD